MSRAMGRGENSRVIPRASFWRRKANLLLVLLWAGESTCAAYGFTVPGGASACFGAAATFACRRSLPGRCRGLAERRRRQRGWHTRLQAEFIEDEYARLVRRMARLERIVSEQNTEMEVMRSSMEDMRMIIQIQAQIDSILVEGGEEGLMSARMEVGARGEPDPRLVKQALRLLRMRQRVLQAWEYEDMEVEEEQTGEALASEFSAMRGLRGLAPSNDPILRRDSRRDDTEEYAYSMYDSLDSRAAAAEEGNEEASVGFLSRLAQRPPKTNQDAADAAGAGVVAALMEGRRRLIVDVDDAQLRYNSPQFCHEAMAEFVELLVLPLTTALENLNAEQNRCKIVIQGAHHVAQAKQAMVLDAPDSLQVVSLEDAKVAKKDRVVALVAPENWTGKKGKHLKRVLAEAHDSAIILINPTGADKFLRPEDFNTFELVYHLRPMRVNYLQPLPPPQYPPPPQYGAEGGEASVEPTGEALLLESLGESVRAEEIALAAGAAEEEAAAVANAAAAAGITAAAAAAAATEGEQEAAAGNPAEELSPFDGPSAVGAAAVAAEIEVRAAERALGRAALEMGIVTGQEKDWSGMDIGYRDHEWAELEGERILDEAAAAAMAAWEIAEHGEEGAGREEDGAGEKRERWGEAEVGEWPGADEAAEMAALAVTLRQYPDAWEAYVDLHDGMGFRHCGTWDLEPPPAAVKTVVMDHILRIVMD